MLSLGKQYRRASGSARDSVMLLFDLYGTVGLVMRTDVVNYYSSEFLVGFVLRVELYDSKMWWVVF